MHAKRHVGMPASSSRRIIDGACGSGLLEPGEVKALVLTTKSLLVIVGVAPGKRTG